MMVDGLVSIIMPSWNTERFIAETIQSVIDQTYTNWELIIVDDCSSDNTDEVVASFKDKRIKYLHNEKNSGAALTRNKALREGIKQNYYLTGREWPYKNVPRRIIAEKYMVDESGYELKDYKYYCFDGKVKLVMINSDRMSAETTKANYFDENYHPLDFT